LQEFEAATHGAQAPMRQAQVRTQE
jgi:hypothetical protein